MDTGVRRNSGRRSSGAAPPGMEAMTSGRPVEYPESVRFMEDRVASIRAGVADELLWFLEHPPLYTAGTSARDGDLLDARFPVHRTGRGGQYTYHGPGQRVVYVMLDLQRRQRTPDIRKYVWQLEEWLIRSVAAFGIAGQRRDGRVGIWVESPDGGEAKIAAIGVRVRRGVTYHGVSLNVAPDLSHFSGIVPCGIRGHGVTSLAKELGGPPEMKKVDRVLISEWNAIFNGEIGIKRAKNVDIIVNSEYSSTG